MLLGRACARAQARGVRAGRGARAYAINGGSGRGPIMAATPADAVAGIKATDNVFVQTASGAPHALLVSVRRAGVPAIATQWPASGFSIGNVSMCSRRLRPSRVAARAVSERDADVPTHVAPKRYFSVCRTDT